MCHRLGTVHDGRVAADRPPAEVVTPDLLHDVFGVHARVVPTGTFRCSPMPARPSETTSHHMTRRPGKAAIAQSLVTSGIDSSMHWVAIIRSNGSR